MLRRYAATPLRRRYAYILMLLPRYAMFDGADAAMPLIFSRVDADDSAMFRHVTICCFRRYAATLLLCVSCHFFFFFSLRHALTLAMRALRRHAMAHDMLLRAFATCLFSLYTRAIRLITPQE